MSLQDLPTLATRPTPNLQKGVPHQIAKAEKAKTKKQQDAAFRAAVWARDEGKSRASKRPLVKSGTTDWKKLGEVHHVLARSTDPDKRLDPSNGLLLSKEEHALAGTNCPRSAHRLLDIVGPEDRGQPQTFIWRDGNGHELRRRVG